MANTTFFFLQHTMTDPRRKMNGRKPDPRKDKLAYFADNIQTHDEEDFDPKMYYYQRDKEVELLCPFCLQ